MEKSLEKHPIYWFFGLFVAVCIVLVAVYYATLYRVAPVNNIADSEAFLRSTFARYQDVGNIFQGTIAIAVSLAGTAVAIILAMVTNTAEVKQAVEANTAAIIPAAVTNTAEIIPAAVTNTADVIPAAVVETADIIRAVDSDIDAAACKDN